MKAASRRGHSGTAAFVDVDSIVRCIWGDADLILLIFAGAAAEFPLNRAVDWLYVTGRLPRDPFGRLFSTAAHAQQIVFADEQAARRTLGRIRAAHAAVERQRGQRIPDWAHRDVLYLLVDYSERAYAAVYRPLVQAEQQELWAVFRRVGEELGIPALPGSYTAWREDRERHLERDLVFSPHTRSLYGTYRRHLGRWRYRLLLGVQGALVPPPVRRHLGLSAHPLLRRALRFYPGIVRLGLRRVVQWALIPAAHVVAVRRFDQPRASSR